MNAKVVGPSGQQGTITKLDPTDGEDKVYGVVFFPGDSPQWFIEVSLKPADDVGPERSPSDSPDGWMCNFTWSDKQNKQHVCNTFNPRTNPLPRVCSECGFYNDESSYDSQVSTPDRENNPELLPADGTTACKNECGYSGTETELAQHASECPMKLPDMFASMDRGPSVYTEHSSLRTRPCEKGFGFSGEVGEVTEHEVLCTGPERRIAEDGKPYSKEDFIAYYGAGPGEKQWENAKPVDPYQPPTQPDGDSHVNKKTIEENEKREQQLRENERMEQQKREAAERKRREETHKERVRQEERQKRLVEEEQQKAMAQFKVNEHVEIQDRDGMWLPGIILNGPFSNGFYQVQYADGVIPDDLEPAGGNKRPEWIRKPKQQQQQTDAKVDEEKRIDQGCLYTNTQFQDYYNTGWQAKWDNARYPGQKVQAEYKNKWYDATITGPGTEPNTYRLSWDNEGTHATHQAANRIRERPPPYDWHAAQGWNIQTDGQGKQFYWNGQTGESRWVSEGKPPITHKFKVGDTVAIQSKAGNWHQGATVLECVADGQYKVRYAEGFVGDYKRPEWVREPSEEWKQLQQPLPQVHHKFPIGHTVEIQMADKSWMPGTIIRHHPNGMYGVQYVDGGIPQPKREEWIRERQPAPIPVHIPHWALVPDVTVINFGPDPPVPNTFPNFVSPNKPPAADDGLEEVLKKIEQQRIREE